MRSTAKKDDGPNFDAKEAAKEWLRIQDPTPAQYQLIESLALLLEGVFAEGLHIGLCLKTMQICEN